MKLTCMIATSVAFAAVGTANAAVPTFQGIGQINPSKPWTEPTSVTPDGNTVFGIYMNGSNWDTFRWTRAGGFTGLNIPQIAANSDFHAGISSDGTVLAGNYMGTGGDYAYRWTQAGGRQNLGVLPGFSGSAVSSARGISADGSVIVGTSSGNVSPSGDYRHKGFRWTQTGMVALAPAISNGDVHVENVSSDGSVIVGAAEFTFSGNSQAFRWTQDGGYQLLGDLPGGSVGSGADYISDDKTTIIGTSSSANGREAFRWTQAGGMVGLGDLSGGEFRSFTYGVSADGSRIVGYGGTTDSANNNVSRATIWDESHGMRRLDEVLTGMGLDVSGWILSSARAISPDGNTIVGFGLSPAGKAEGWIAVIPEPGGLTLLITSLTCALGRRRQRHHITSQVRLRPL